MKTSTVVSTIFLLSCGSVVVAEIEIIWVSVSFEIDKVITVVIIQIVPISSGKPKVTFNHKTDKIVADNGSIQYI